MVVLVGDQGQTGTDDDHNSLLDLGGKGQWREFEGITNVLCVHLVTLVISSYVFCFFPSAFET